MLADGKRDGAVDGLLRIIPEKLGQRVSAHGGELHAFPFERRPGLRRGGCEIAAGPIDELSKRGGRVGVRPTPAKLQNRFTRLLEGRIGRSLDGEAIGGETRNGSARR